MNIKEISANSYISASKLPDADYVINPYVGCPHKCIYCYAEFMKRFTGHSKEEWGTFVDIKNCKKSIKCDSYSEKTTILFGSVTDPYNALEKKYCRTRDILEQLTSCKARIEVLTKSDLVVRDIEVFQKIPNLYVGISMNTMDDSFRKDIEPFAASVERRIEALKTLHENNIRTYVFVSPIFPELTDCISILNAVRPYVEYICFENLNLRGSYMPRVMEYIKRSHPEYEDIYKTIFWNKNYSYWRELETMLRDYCDNHDVDYRIYFYHDKIKKK